MQIRDLFATAITERIEPVVKVLDRKPAVVAAELNSLVVTQPWERFLSQVLDAYAHAADRDDEEGVGIWISGFFGSGKSLLMKVLGTLLQGGDLGTQRVQDLFLNRLPGDSPDRADLQRFLTICERKLSTTVVGGNLHAELATEKDTLSLITFKLFARDSGFTHNWPFAWVVESQIDRQGKTAVFRARAEALAGVEWEEIVDDTSFHTSALYQAAADTLPASFKTADEVTRACDTANLEGGITATNLISRLLAWCKARDADGKRHKLLLELDELGQWIRGGSNSTERIMQVQALIETAAAHGGGRIWIAVTAHGDVQALSANVQQEQYAKINQRFTYKVKLSNDDIGKVVEQRLLRKHQAERSALIARFDQRSGELTDLGSIANPRRGYPPPTADSFALYYPYLPWTVEVIPDVVRGIAHAAHRGEELSGSTRTLIGVVQGALLDTPGLLDAPVGRLLPLSDLYDGLASDVPMETKTDLNSIKTKVAGATPFTSRVAQALYLLGTATYIPQTLENVARALVDDLDTSLSALRAATKIELDRLIAAGYAKLAGEEYAFLSTQQRGFQDGVRARQAILRDNTNELIQALKDYDSDPALGFADVSLAGRDLKLRQVIDTRVVRNPAAAVTLQVSSPFQRVLDPDIGDDAKMKQRSLASATTLLVRLAAVPDFRDALSLAMATALEADMVISGVQYTEPEKAVAREAKARDLPSNRAEVQRLLALSVRGADIFFNGNQFSLVADGTANAVRATLSQPQLIPTIYSRFSELPHRIVNEEAAVKAALSGNATNPDLQALAIYKADGTVNEAHPLLSTLRGRLPLAEKDLPPIPADELRQLIEQPPFGWDPNAAKVGLAVLLRGSACRLVDNGRYITDPAAPDAARLLSKDQPFRSLRVQGVQGDLDTPTLKRVRETLESLFGTTRLPLVAATLHNELGTSLNALATRAKEIVDWAATAHCPLPNASAAGRDVAQELAAIGSPAPRLREFLEQAATLQAYVTLLGSLEVFRAAHAADFGAFRDFYNRMLNASLGLPELDAFIKNWQTLTVEATVTDAARWREIEASHAAAQQALSRSAVALHEQTAQELAAVEARLPDDLRKAGVPNDMFDEELQRLMAKFSNVRYRLQPSSTDAIAARSAHTALQSAKLELVPTLHELKRTYAPTTSIDVVRIGWQELLGTARIATAGELEAAIVSLRTQVEPLLGATRTVEIE